jgi:hypothetical protein
MNRKKEISEIKNSSKQPNAERRAFMWKTGAAMTAVIASAATGVSKTSAGENDWKLQLDRLSNQVGMLEDANAIRSLHQTFENHIDQGRYEEAFEMFSDNAEVRFNGGRFIGEDGIRRLFCDHFVSGKTGKKIEAAPGFELGETRQVDTVEVAADRKTATGRFPYSIQVGTPMTGNSSLIEMARLQGEGIFQWWEGGIHEVSYTRTGTAWKISGLEYRAISQADYKPGRSSAKPISVPLFSEVFPIHRTGPDKLV